MLAQEFTLDNQNKILNTTFDVKQILIKNSSQYPIYIKTSGGNPTIKDFEFLVQGNSDFASGVVGTRTVTVYTPANDFINVAVVTLCDNIVTSPNNTGYLTGQSVGNLHGFPLDLSNVLLTGDNNNLPIIQFNNANPIYFILQSTYAMILGVSPNADGNNISPFGGCDPTKGDSTIGFYPQILNTNTTIYLVPHPSAPNPYPQLIVSTFYSSILIYKNNARKFAWIDVGSIGSQTFYSYVSPPAFYYRLRMSGSNPTYAYSFTVTLRLESAQGQAGRITIFSQTFTGTSNLGFATELVLVDNTLVINPDYRFMTLTVVTNNAAPSNVQMNLDVWEYEH